MRQGSPVTTLDELDAIDRDILAALLADGRATNQALADEVGLSPSACLRRVRRLEESGVIEGYTAVPRAAAVGQGRIVVVEVSLTSQREEVMAAFETAVADLPGLRSCHLLAGDADYLLVLAVADVDGYERIHRDHLARLPSVARLRTSVALRSVVDRPWPPLPPVGGHR